MFNICHNCVDRWAEKTPDVIALAYDSTMTNTKTKFTFKELLDNVSRLGGVL